MTVIQLRAPIELRASSFNALPSQFEGTGYSGGLVKTFGVVIDLSTTSANGPMPLLAEHQRDKIIGVVSGLINDGQQLTVSGKLFSDMPGGEAARVAELSKRGAPFQLSVGLFGYREEYVPAGQAITVNSRTFRGPVTVLRGGVVREISVVTLGADADAKARLFSGNSASRLNPHDILARRRREALGQR